MFFLVINISTTTLSLENGRVLEIYASVYNPEFFEVERLKSIFYQKISSDHISGITPNMISKYGKPPRHIMNALKNLLLKYQPIIVGHGIHNIIMFLEKEFRIANIYHEFCMYRKVCTMNESRKLMCADKNMSLETVHNIINQNKVVQNHNICAKHFLNVIIFRWICSRL